MANHKSAIKRASQNRFREMRNRSVKTRVKNVIKKVRTAVDENSPDSARQALILAQSVIDAAASRGVIHKNTASRRISRLARHVGRTSA
ncbi:30S ribosomal protein S20 [Thermodesulfobacteriota bacterium]